MGKIDDKKQTFTSPYLETEYYHVLETTKRFRHLDPL